MPRWEQGTVWSIFAVTKATWSSWREDREEEPDSSLVELFICFCSTKDYLRSFFPTLTLCKSCFAFKGNLSQDCNHGIKRPTQGHRESTFTENSHTQQVCEEPFNELTKCIKHLKTLALSPQESTAKCMAKLKFLAVLEIVPAEQIRSEWVGENRLFSKFGTWNFKSALWTEIILSGLDPVKAHVGRLLKLIDLKVCLCVCRVGF